MRNPHPLYVPHSRAHTTVSFPTLRRVWAAVTLAPNASIRALGARLGIGYSQVRCALAVLRDAGYLTYPDHATGARVVIVGLYPPPHVKKGLPRNE